MSSEPRPETGAPPGDEPTQARGAAATGIGSMPGEDFAEAVRTVFGELPDLPHLPELPARGVTAAMPGRTLAVVSELGFDLQPAGWRLTDASGVDHRRARSLLAQDLDTLEDLTEGYVGPLKLQLAGPWTLAATVERPRGDRVLGDVGARRELAQALALGIGEHVADVRRRVPGASVLVQLDEPALPGVLAGQVPTSSGFHRHRAVDTPRASEALEWAFAAVAEAGAESVAHCCAADVPVGLLRGAGAGAVSVDLAVLAASAYDDLGTTLDAGQRVLLGVLPAVDPSGSTGRSSGAAAASAAARAVADRVLRLLDMLGFDPDAVAGRLVLTPACGLAGASPSYARDALRLLREAARLFPG
ncbi:uroporphyrinogen decarboxylase/cobalamine-independent methonine synthase family protein [Nocardioides terrisoli]|uniref:methionine synthase n=1 Tax=Nocardioides terrisoli TaxID=3388267 RepID=UPI00287BB07A|nr:methionine synthase [Nocardioides marmorisolisilvae]